MSISIEQIGNLSELAVCSGVSLKTLTWVLYEKKIDSFYNAFTIKKRNGKDREICAPRDVLKKMLTELSSSLDSYYRKLLGENNKIPQAFIKGRSIYTNASIHKRKKYIAHFDIESFFDSFNFGRVVGYLMKSRAFQLKKEVAYPLANLLCYKGKLPQGSPASPVMTNFMAQILDSRLSKIAKKYKLAYSRYADDLIFSTNRPGFEDAFSEFEKEVNDEVEKTGFVLNKEKTNFIHGAKKKKVTGIVVNEKLNVDRKYYKQLRGMLNRYYLTGEIYQNNEPMSVSQLMGKLAFCRQTKKECNKENIKRVPFDGKSRDYRRLVFFERFYHMPKPLICCEGYTDIIHLKTALLSLQNLYPELIKKGKNGKIEFAVNFIKRPSSKTKGMLNDLFFIDSGADTWGKFFKRFYLGEGDNDTDSENIYSYFKKEKRIKASNPIIMVFDNEFFDSKKASRPITKFFKSSVNDGETFEKLKDASLEYAYSYRNTNVSILPIPRIGKDANNEIEDLYDESVFKNVDGNKIFSGDSTKNETQYNKADFAKYVYKNRESINFEKFKPLLNNIKEIIKKFNEDSR